MITDESTLHLFEELEQLEQEHSELDQDLHSPENQVKLDQLTLQKLKKRKLYIKDRINALNILLCHNEIA